MSLQDVTEFANANSACYFATAIHGQPRVRAVWMWFADESGFYFHTGASKNFYKQLVGNPKVEICFFNSDPQTGKMLRVTGVVEFVDDRELKARLVEERPFLKALGSGADDPNLILFRVVNGEAYFWTMADNLRENEIPRINF